MPVYFNDLVFDYYLVYLTICTLAILSIIGLVASSNTSKNTSQLMYFICIGLAVCLGVWVLLIARVAFAVYANRWYLLYPTYFVLVLTVYTMIQMILMTTYIKFAYNTIVFRLLLGSLLLKSVITYLYYANYGDTLMYTFLGMCMESVATFILVSMVSARFAYYLKHN